MDLAVIQIQALVKQTQYQYLMAFALKLGQRLIGPIERMETHNGMLRELKRKPYKESSSDLSTADSKDFPAFTAFQPNIKRVCTTLPDLVLTDRSISLSCLET